MQTSSPFGLTVYVEWVGMWTLLAVCVAVVGVRVGIWTSSPFGLAVCVGVIGVRVGMQTLSPLGLIVCVRGKWHMDFVAVWPGNLCCGNSGV